MANSNRYFLSIDGFRLIASINIVLFHLEGLGGLYNMGGTPAWLFRIIKGPAFHATVFFILGGFIFTMKFSSQADSFKNFQFLKKRFFELYPLHILTTILMMLLFLIHRLPSGELNVQKFLFSTFMHLSFLWSLFPFSSYSFNTPSWALSAFFLCYILFGPMLKLVTRIGKRSIVVLYLLLFGLILLMWSLFYGALGTPEKLYTFFHIFAPLRFFEFGIGMMLARFFQLSTEKKPQTPFTGLRNDFLIVIATILIYQILQLRSKDNPLLTFMSYHLLLTPFYCLILYLLALENGFISRILSVPLIRNTGRSSFYPYLIHIPLISLAAYACEKFLSYYRLLHAPVNIVSFMVVLYGSSFVYVNYIRKRSRPPSATKKIPEKERSLSVANK